MAKALPTRRKFLTVAAGVTAPAFVGLPARSAPKRQPNLLYVFSDEHRWQSMAHTELPQVQSPNMTRLAKEGFEFKQSISNYPVCSPYRAILQTGRWPHQQGVIDNKIPLDPNQPTFGSTFRDAGYKTSYVGKWHLGGTRAEPYGWDHSLVWTGDGNHRKATYHPADQDPIEQRGYTVDNKTDQTLAFIEQNKNVPFCAAISYNTPHARFTDAPDDLNAKYPPGSIPWRPNAKPSEGGKSGGAFTFTDEGYRGYHAHVTGTDRALGRIIDAIDDWGLAEDTILIYTSDHGTMFGSHGVGSKRQPFEESIRVPFICRWPGRIKPNTSSDALFGTIDLLPTLCAMAGVDQPNTCQGQDFSPWLFGEKGPDPDHQPIMHISKKNASYGDDHPAPIFRGVRTKRHTYAVYTDRLSALYDNQEDPYQLNNRYNDEKMATTLNTCRAQTKAWLPKANDPFPLSKHERAPA